MPHSLKRISCDVRTALLCKKVSPWEFLPEGIFPHPKGWVLSKDSQICPACFLKMSRKQYADEKAEDMSKRVLIHRQGLALK